jgi:hypothetical protein
MDREQRNDKEKNRKVLLKDFDYELPEELIAQYLWTGGTTRACWSWKERKTACTTRFLPTCPPG